MEFDDIVELVGSLLEPIKANARQHLSLLQKDIDEIILQKRKAAPPIERILDTLLDYSQLGIGKEEFLRLNAYYATFKPNNAQSYKKYYDELV